MNTWTPITDPVGAWIAKSVPSPMVRVFSLLVFSTATVNGVGVFEGVFSTDLSVNRWTADIAPVSTWVAA